MWKSTKLIADDWSQFIPETTGTAVELKQSTALDDFDESIEFIQQLAGWSKVVPEVVGTSRELARDAVHQSMVNHKNRRHRGKVQK